MKWVYQLERRFGRFAIPNLMLYITTTTLFVYLADLILLDFNAPHLKPNHNTIANLVYAAHGSDVCLTMVDGRIVYER